jgi:membrane protease subunit HflC
MRRILIPVLLIIAIFVGLTWAAEYGYPPLVITKENEFKVIVGVFGPRAEITEPGWDPLVWNIPIFDDVYVFDRRLQYLNAKPVQVLIANNEKLIVDYYVLWKVTQPLNFLQNFPKGISTAESRIQEVVKSLVGSRIGGLQLSQLLKRAEILTRLDEDSNERLAGTGVEVVDVRLNRTELPPNAVPAAYAQMREQRTALAREHRAQGERQAREIRANADREAVSTLAKSRSKASRVRGEGDANSTRIFGLAHNKDPEFYGFIRSLEAYRKTMGPAMTLVVSPDHEFYRYLDVEIETPPATSRVSALPPRPRSAPRTPETVLPPVSVQLPTSSPAESPGVGATAGE